MFVAGAVLGRSLVLPVADHPAAERTPTSIRLAKGSVIAAQGDSLTYGFDISPEGTRPPINGSDFTRSTNPFPEALGLMMPGCTILNEGFPGDRSVDGLVRWQDAPRRDLTLLMFGSNDALNNGHASSGIVGVEIFHIVMSAIVDRREASGEKVALLIRRRSEIPRRIAGSSPTGTRREPWRARRA